MNRRTCILAALAAVGLDLPVTRRAPAAEKMSKKEADYQDDPKDIRMCATCSLFEPPRACKVVDGDISPNGWCKVFAFAD